MDDIQMFSKILNVREKERRDAELFHQASIQTFESIATELYNILKKKEEAESFTTNSLQKITIDRLREQQDYIERLKQKIIQLQAQVSTARTQMETSQFKLSETHIEVKKFETIIDSCREEQKEKEQKLDQASMDDISMQQYLSKRLGV